jgi:hypothetical protein
MPSDVPTDLGEMSNLDLSNLSLGQPYTRKELAKMWGYASQKAIERGVVTPAGKPTIILFVTINKQSHLPQYKDELRGGTLIIDGETEHGTDARLQNSALRDKVFLFFRVEPKEPFVFKGEVVLVHSELRKNEPSLFVFQLKSYRP